MRQVLRALVPVACLLGCSPDASRAPSSAAPAPDAPAGMTWIPGGEFTMGSADPLARADERPLHRVRVDGFWMDATEVTNAQFAAFVAATGYRTFGAFPNRLVIADAGGTVVSTGKPGPYSTAEAVKSARGTLDSLVGRKQP